MKNYKTEWDLEKHFYESIEDPRIQQTVDTDLKQVGEFVTKYGGEGAVSSLNPEGFLNFINETNTLMKGMTKVYTYYSYLNTLDTQNQVVLKRMSGLGFHLKGE